MNAINYNNEEVTLTEMETELYTGIKEYSEMDDCFACAANEVTTIPMNKLRGVIASLEKKGIAYVDELISGCGKWVILYEKP